jgi:hypothetical protein
MSQVPGWSSRVAADADTQTKAQQSEVQQFGRCAACKAACPSWTANSICLDMHTCQVQLPRSIARQVAPIWLSEDQHTCINPEYAYLWVKLHPASIQQHTVFCPHQAQLKLKLPPVLFILSCMQYTAAASHTHSCMLSQHRCGTNSQMHEGPYMTPMHEVVTSAVSKCFAGLLAGQLTALMEYASLAAYSRQREKRKSTCDAVFSEARGPCRP